jgi:hypothetical protein
MTMTRIAIVAVVCGILGIFLLEAQRCWRGPRNVFSAPD